MQDDIRNVVEGIAIWRLTILLVKICEEKDSDERKRSRSEARHERWIPAWRKRVKDMTTEEMNEFSWSTHEKMIKKGQTDDDFAIIQSREKKEDIHSEFDMGSSGQAGMGADEGHVSKKMQRAESDRTNSQYAVIHSRPVTETIHNFEVSIIQMWPNCVKGSQVLAVNFFIEERSRIDDSMSLFLWIVVPRISLKHPETK